jgi:hypothetical protein
VLPGPSYRADSAPGYGAGRAEAFPAASLLWLTGVVPTRRWPAIRVGPRRRSNLALSSFPATASGAQKCQT